MRCLVGAPEVELFLGELAVVPFANVADEVTVSA